MIFIFGDSHRARFLHYDREHNTKPRVKVFGDAGLTAYGMGGIKEPGLSVGGMPYSRGWPMLDEMLKEVGPDDVILFVLGEVDCRIHLYYHHWLGNVPIKVVVDEAVRRYGTALSKVSEEYRIAVLSVLPAVAQGNVYEIAYYGTRTERAVITKMFNKALETFCISNDIPFIDTWKHLADEDGFLADEHAESDGAHALPHTVGFVDLTPYYPGATLCE
jgi:hypothetical protein